MKRLVWTILILLLPVSSAVECGEHLSQSVVLDADLECETMNGLVIYEADNVLVDCAGHAITSLGAEDPYESRGIWLFHSQNVTVENCTFDAWGRAIHFVDWPIRGRLEPFSANTTLINNVIRNSKSVDIESRSHGNISIINNTMIGHPTNFGIFLHQATGILIEDNTFITATTPTIRFYYNQEPTNDTIRIINNTFNITNGGEFIDLDGASGAVIAYNTKVDEGESIGFGYSPYSLFIVNRFVLFGATEVHNSAFSEFFLNRIYSRSNIMNKVSSPSCLLHDNEFGRISPDSCTGLRFSDSSNSLWQNNITNYSYPVDVSRKNLFFRNNFYPVLGGRLVDNGDSQTETVSDWNLSTEGNYHSNFDEPSEGCNDTNGDGQCDIPLRIFDVYSQHHGAYDYHPYVRPNGWLERPPSGSPLFRKVIQHFQLACREPPCSD
ncbi:MAG: right-handed parallel beta-helix repeat-containing protein [Nanoarchaeota archaeon]